MLSVFASKRLTIGGDVTTVSKSAYFGGSGYEVLLKESVTKIESGAFQGAGLNKITICGAETEIGESAFEACSRLKSAELPEKLTVLPPQSIFRLFGINRNRFAGHFNNPRRQRFFRQRNYYGGSLSVKRETVSLT